VNPHVVLRRPCRDSPIQFTLKPSCSAYRVRSLPPATSPFSCRSASGEVECHLHRHQIAWSGGSLSVCETWNCSLLQYLSFYLGVGPIYVFGSFVQSLNCTIFLSLLCPRSHSAEHSLCSSSIYCSLSRVWYYRVCTETPLSVFNFLFSLLSSSFIHVSETVPSTANLQGLLTTGSSLLFRQD